MIGWSEGYNWTKEQTLNAVRGETHVVLNCEHNDYNNMLNMVKWLDDAGFNAVISDSMERIVADKRGTDNAEVN